MKHLPRFLFSAAAVLAVSTLGAHPFDGPREALAARLKTDAALRQALLQNARPVTADFDYTRLLDKDTDVLLLGEQHGDPAAKREVNVILKSLAAHNGGCTHLASEFFLSEEQPALDAFSSKQITLEQLEKLEQLRALEDGMTIKCVEIRPGGPAIDTAEDLKAAKKYLKERE